MGLKDDVDPWEEIARLQAELVELKAEVQASHDVLDGAGADNEIGIKEVAEGPQKTDYRLPARMIRFVLTHACPLGKLR